MLNKCNNSWTMNKSKKETLEVDVSLHILSVSSQRATLSRNQSWLGIKYRNRNIIPYFIFLSPCDPDLKTMYIIFQTFPDGTGNLEVSRLRSPVRYPAAQAAFAEVTESQRQRGFVWTRGAWRCERRVLSAGQGLHSEQAAEQTTAISTETARPSDSWPNGSTATFNPAKTQPAYWGCFPPGVSLGNLLTQQLRGKWFLFSFVFTAIVFSSYKNSGIFFFFLL